ncbi:MAG: hypothetical protein GY762_08635 [Proteobacteria bacterium]|nr:hypothetical protein [Pseudomonadota bacterium]
MHLKQIISLSLFPGIILALFSCTFDGIDSSGDGVSDVDTDSDWDPNTDFDAGRDVPTDPIMDGMLEAHNAVRANASPAPDPQLEPLNWSEKLAADASAWASNCIMAHDPATGDLRQGENWYAWSRANDRTAQDVVLGEGWAAEATDYDYESHTCDGGDAIGCGHYTQIVWRDTTHVGCAVQVCPNGLTNWEDGREIWFCRYHPPGNWIGERPY